MKILGNKYPVKQEIAMFNLHYTQMSIYSDTVGLRTPESVIKGAMYSKYNRFLGQEYLMNYRTDNVYIGFGTGVFRFFETDAALTAVNRDLEEELSDVVYLPKPKPIKSALSSVITSRRSIRHYEKEKISKQDLSNILYYAQGISGEIEAANVPVEHNKISLRNAPSGGGLYPIYLYFLALNIEGVNRGIYKYYPYSHSIKPVNLEVDNISPRDFAEFGNINSEDCAIFMFYVYDFYVNSRKYGDSGLMYAVIETGEIAQNIQLTSTALGYGCCDIGGYNKQFCEKVLKLDGINKHMIHLTIIG